MILDKKFIIENLLDKRGGINKIKMKKNNITKTKEEIYWVLNDMSEAPKCPTCGKRLSFYRESGYRTYCSVKCKPASKLKITPVKFEDITKEFLENNLLNKNGGLSSTKLRIFDINVSYEKLFLIQNNMIEIPKCKVCNNNAVFKSFTKGYGTYCSHKCSAVCKENNYNKKQTNFEKYGVENVFQSKEFLEKRKQTNLERYGHIYYHKSETGKKHLVEIGHYIDDKARSDWELYKVNVLKCTNNNDLSILENFDNRGLCGVDGAYQLDHKLSIWDGFHNNILPHIIGDIKNLEMLPWKENNKKRRNSSISLDDLIKL